MGEFLNQIPYEIQDHIIKITKTSGLPDNEESYEKIAEGWLEKKKIFEDEIVNMEMEEVDHIDASDNRGALAMTYSGSLLNIGPVIDGARKVSYASIGLRQDVPDLATKEECTLEKDLDTDHVYEFMNGPVKKTSPIYKIIVCKDDLPEEVQEEKLTEMATIMIDDFVEVNKTIVIE
ncbi:MAG: hypothetical protein JXB50_05960 [Spirochaetes bacterium]|nr:hypothetical protein [Spirochaetota bacterium]